MSDWLNQPFPDVSSDETIHVYVKDVPAIMTVGEKSKGARHLSAPPSHGSMTGVLRAIVLDDFFTFISAMRKDTLHHTCELGDMTTIWQEILERRLTQGDPSLWTNIRLTTPLMCAVSLGRKQMIQALLRAGVDPSLIDNDGIHAVLVAAAVGCEEPTFWCSPKVAGLINTSDKLGRSPLYLAAMQGSLPVVERLLAAGAEVHCRELSGRTPIWIAIECQHFKVASLLIANTSASAINVRNNEGIHFTELLRDLGQLSLALPWIRQEQRYLWEAETDLATKLLLHACGDADEGLLEALLPVPTSQWREMGSQLLRAILAQPLAIGMLQLLLQQADISLDGDEEGPSSYVLQAASYGHWDMVQVLLHRGCRSRRPEWHSAEGSKAGPPHSALTYALLVGNKYMAALLLHYELNLLELGQPLKVALTAGKREVVLDVLLHHGGDISQQQLVAVSECALSRGYTDIWQAAEGWIKQGQAKPTKPLMT